MGVILFNTAASYFSVAVFTPISKKSVKIFNIFFYILNKVPLIWIIERNISFQKSAFEKKGKNQAAAENEEEDQKAVT